MSRWRPMLLAGLMAPAVAAAQGKSVVEIGTSLGLTILSANGSTTTHFGVPGEGILGQPTIYLSFFAGKSLLVEPQVAFNLVSSDGDTFTTFGLSGQLAYLTKGTGVNSPFVAASLGFQSASGGGDSNTDEGLGVKIGYRFLSGSSLGFRLEAGYRRWFDSHLNEITFGVGIGGIVHKKG